MGNSAKTQTEFTGALLIVTSLIGHSFNTAFTNCENVKCITVRYF